MLEGADLTAPEGLRLTLLSPVRSGVSGHQPVTASPAHLTTSSDYHILWDQVTCDKLYRYARGIQRDLNASFPPSRMSRVESVQIYYMQHYRRPHWIRNLPHNTQ